MTRELLADILRRSPSVDEVKKAFEAKDGHDVSFYLGTPGQAIIVADVKRIVLEAQHVEIAAADRRTFYVDYETVIGIAARTPRDAEAQQRKTGFA